MSEPDVPETGTVSVTEDSQLQPEEFEAMLQKECKAWQRRLGLRDWNIRVHLVRLHEMPDPSAIGAIRPFLERRDAQMFLLNPIDIPLLAQHFLDDEEVNYDLTIVHELLHLHMAPFTQRADEAEQVAEEQAINAISRALVKSHAKQHSLIAAPAVKPSAQVGFYL